MTIHVMLGLSLGLGLLIGLQRERAGARMGGIRTFPLISLFGTFCALLANEYGGGVLVTGLAAVFGSLAISNFIKHEATGHRDPGQTTEFAALLTFTLGALVVRGNASIIIVTTGVIMLLLHSKTPMHGFVEKMGEYDMTAIMQFVVISLIVLPLLPDRTYGPYQVLNPFDIWRMVVLIVGISLCGYVAYKIWGEQAGAILGGVLGGMISSTATTVSYARRTHSTSGPQWLAVFVVLTASTISFVRVLLELAIVAPSTLFQLALPIGAMLFWMIVLSLLVLVLARGQRDQVPQQANPAELKSALVFGALYAIILFAVGAARHHFGETALYGVALISGLTDMDAITLSIGRMVEERRIDPDNGWRLVLTASLANLVFKAGAAAFLGARQFAFKVVLSFAVALAGGLVVLWFWPGQ